MVSAVCQSACISSLSPTSLDQSFKGLLKVHNMAMGTFEQKPSGSEIPVLNRVHFIWMGNLLPDQYKIHLAAWQGLYPDKEFILWIDSNNCR